VKSLRNPALKWWIIAAVFALLSLAFATNLIKAPSNDPRESRNDGFAVACIVVGAMMALFAVLDGNHSAAARKLVGGHGLLTYWEAEEDGQPVDGRKTTKAPPRVRRQTWIGREGLYTNKTYYSWTAKRIRTFTLHTEVTPHTLEVEIELPSAVSFISLFASYSHGPARLVILVPPGHEADPERIAAELGVTLTIMVPAEG
jgi:hypothetical protein